MTADLTADLCDLLDIEETDTDLYRGKDGFGRVFGGQVIAQALQAAALDRRAQERPFAPHLFYAPRQRGLSHPAPDRHPPRVGPSSIGPVTTEPRPLTWFRICSAIAEEAALHRAILAYASDMTLLGTGTLPHGINGITPKLQSASLDHAMWLHEEFRVDDWLLYSCDSPWTGRARSFNRGQIFTRDGRLVTSVAQEEGLMRLRK